MSIRTQFTPIRTTVLALRNDDFYDMELKTFTDFWIKNSKEWYQNATARKAGAEEAPVPVRSLCTIKPDIAAALYDRYEKVKDFTKRIYFKNPTKKLSCYKRAAIIAQAILLSDPLEYIELDVDQLDPYFLKQRLAFYMAITSILQLFSEEQITELAKKDKRGEIYHLSDLGIGRQPDEDTFLMSVYKDMFYSELYGNYNILTMANVFGLLTERSSEIRTLLLEKAKSPIME